MHDHSDYNDQNLNNNGITERRSSSTEETFHSSRSGRRRKVLSRLSTQVDDCNDQNLNNEYARLRITIQSVRVVVCGEQPAAEGFLLQSVREITERQTSCAEEPLYSSRSGRRRKVLSRHPTQVGKNSSVSTPPFYDIRLHAFYWQCHIC